MHLGIRINQPLGPSLPGSILSRSWLSVVKLCFELCEFPLEVLRWNNFISITIFRFKTCPRPSPSSVSLAEVISDEPIPVIIYPNHWPANLASIRSNSPGSSAAPCSQSLGDAAASRLRCCRCERRRCRRWRWSGRRPATGIGARWK